MASFVIRTAAQYEATLARIGEIFDATPDTPAGDELERLLTSVEAYEDITYPIDLPDAIAIQQFRSEQ